MLKCYFHAVLVSYRPKLQNLILLSLLKKSLILVL